MRRTASIVKISWRRTGSRRSAIDSLHNFQFTSCSQNPILDSRRQFVKELLHSDFLIIVQPVIVLVSSEKLTLVLPKVFDRQVLKKTNDIVFVNIVSMQRVTGTWSPLTGSLAPHLNGSRVGMDCVHLLIKRFGLICVLDILPVKSNNF
jgi:hypothetical protein